MSVTPPVNVKLQSPTISIPTWNTESQLWLTLNAEIGGNPNFYPLTIKAAYVFGIIHSLCQNVSILLSPGNDRLITYLPAFGLYSSGVDLLGRCIQGNETTRARNDVEIGYRWLASTNFQAVDITATLVTTSGGGYSIDQLVALRHFAAHGQATSRTIPAVDYELLKGMPSLLATGLERYWTALQGNDDMCNNLFRANIIPLRNWPVLSSWILFEIDDNAVYHSVEEIFNRFDWS